MAESPLKSARWDRAPDKATNTPSMRISADHADARVWALTEGSWSPVCPRGAKQFITAWPPTPQREPLIMDHFDDPVCRDLPSRFSPAPSLGGLIAWSQNERSVGGLGTTMMTLTHQTRKNYLLRKEDYGQLHQKFRSSIEILIFYDGCTELR